MYNNNTYNARYYVYASVISALNVSQRTAVMVFTRKYLCLPMNRACLFSVN